MFGRLEETQKKAVVVKIVRSEADFLKRLPPFDSLFTETVEVIEELDWDGKPEERKRIAEIFQRLEDVDYVFLCLPSGAGEYTIGTTRRMTLDQFSEHYLGVVPG